jgi:hypothetical protein
VPAAAAVADAAAAAADRGRGETRIANHPVLSEAKSRRRQKSGSGRTNSRFHISSEKHMLKFIYAAFLCV